MGGLGWDGVVRIATVGGEIFPTYPDRPCGPPSLLPQWVPGRGIDHPTPSSAEVKERVELLLLLPLWAFASCISVNFFLMCSFSDVVPRIATWRLHMPPYIRCVFRTTNQNFSINLLSLPCGIPESCTTPFRRWCQDANGQALRRRRTFFCFAL